MAWLESLQPPLKPGHMPDSAEVATIVWTMMGEMNWQALPAVVELLGVDDVEGLISQLLTIRDFKKRG